MQLVCGELKARLGPQVILLPNVRRRTSDRSTPSCTCFRDHFTTRGLRTRCFGLVGRQSDSCPTLGTPQLAYLGTKTRTSLDLALRYVTPWTRAKRNVINYDHSGVLYVLIERT